MDVLPTDTQDVRGRRFVRMDLSRGHHSISRGNLGLRLVLLTAGIILFWLVSHASLVQPADAENLRLAVFEWASVDTTNEIWDGEYTQGVSSSFLLAAFHFNERRSDIVPSLAEISGCNKNISVISFCETAGNPLRGIDDLLWVLNNKGPVDVISGFGGIEDAIAGSLLAKSWGNIPVMSHWVSAPRVSDKHVFPLFGRTIVNDHDHALVVAKFMKQLGLQNVLLIYLTDGRDFATKFALELKTYGIQLRAFEFQYVDDQYSESINEAVALASHLELKAVVVASWATQLSLLADAFAANHMLDRKTNFFLTYLDRNPTQAEFQANENLYSMFNGAIRISRVVDTHDNANWARYLDAWPEFEGRYRTRINQYLPPFGLNNSRSCANSNFQYQLKPGYFGRTSQLANEVWAQAYDTVLAYGMAVCRLAPNGTEIPNGTAIVEQIRREGFSGMTSDNVRFTETGDPDISTAGFRLVSYHSSGMPQTPIAIEFVGTLNESDYSFNLDMSQVYFRGGLGVLPRDIIAPFHNDNRLPIWARALGYVELALLWLFGIFCAVWLVTYRGNRVVVNSQPQLLALVLLGSMVAAASLIPMTADEFDDLNEDVSCMLLPVLFTMGFQLSTLAIAIKTFRILQLFQNPKLKRYKVPVHRMLLFLMLFLSVPALINILWWAISPLRYIRVETFLDVHGNPIESFGMCDAPTKFSGAMLILNFLLFGISIASVSIMAYKVRSVPSDYHEAKWVALAVVSQCQIFFVAVPTIAAVYRFVLGRFILMSTVVFLSVSILLVCIFVPKMVATVTGKDLTPSFFRPLSKSAKQPLASSPSSVRPPHSPISTPANSPADPKRHLSSSPSGLRPRSMKGDAETRVSLREDAQPPLTGKAEGRANAGDCYT